MKLYIGKPFTTITTLFMIALLAYLCYCFYKRESIQSWGMHIIFLLVFGLVLCCSATMRDGWHLSIQGMIGGTKQLGLFKANGIECILGGILAAIIAICAILSIFFRAQSTKEMFFFIMASSIVLKIGIIEVQRIIAYVSEGTSWLFK